MYNLKVKKMTICFNTYPDMKKFCNKMFSGDTKDNTLPVFTDCNLSFNFKQAQVECNMTEAELSQWLASNKIKVVYVSKF